tara:strand:- start:983 stop:2332 length:1350 start_codon:yes stop_codon:yes gene_type:complete
MAFKFKTKKRPTAAQAFAGGFAQGVSSGIQQAAQLSLQDRLKKQEEFNDLKKRLPQLINLAGLEGDDYKAAQAGQFQVIRGDITSQDQLFNFLEGKSSGLGNRLLGATKTTDISLVGVIDEETGDTVYVPKSQAVGRVKEKAQPKDRKTEKDRFDVLRFTDTGEQVFKGDTPDRPTERDINNRLRFKDDGQLVFPEVKKAEPTVNLQYKTDDQGNQFTFNPSTGQLDLIKKGEKLSETDKLELKNLLQERTRLLALKGGQSKSTFTFPDEMSFTMDSGGATWDDKVNQPQLDRIDKILIDKYGYNWLGEVKDEASAGEIDLQRPPSIPEEAWLSSTKEQKEEAVRLYEASLKPTSENVNPMAQDNQSSEVEVSDSGQQPPSPSDIGFVPQAPNAGMKFKLPPELVKQFDSGSIVVEEMKGDKVILKTDKGIKKVMPLSKWYTYRFAPMT